MPITPVHMRVTNQERRDTMIVNWTPADGLIQDYTPHDRWGVAVANTYGERRSSRAM